MEIPTSYEESQSVNPTLGITLGEMYLDPMRLKLELEASILSPYVVAHITYLSDGGIGDLPFVVGSEGQIVLSGNIGYTELYLIPVVVTGIEVEESSTPRTVAGDIKITVVSNWAYHERGSESKAYINVEDPSEVLEGELEAAGVLAQLNIFERPRSYDKPQTFYRTEGPMHTLETRVLPWTQSESGGAYFWYQRLDGFIDVQSAASMLNQPLAASLRPSMYSYPYEDRGELTAYAYDSRMYETNPTRTDLYNVRCQYFNYEVGSIEEVIDASPVGRTGVALQRRRDSGKDDLEIWYIGNRSAQQREAHAAYMKRRHLFHQVHVIDIATDLEAATVCPPGSRVYLYDFTLTVSEAEDEDLMAEETYVESNMSGEYIVVSSKYICSAGGDAYERDIRVQLELGKLAYDTADLVDMSTNDLVEV